MGQWSRLPANPGAQVQALTRGDSTGLGRLSPRPRCWKAVQPKTINQTFHLKREMAKKKERKKCTHTPTCKWILAQRIKTYGCALSLLGQGCLSGLPFVPRHCFFPASTVFAISGISPYLFIYFFSIPSRFLSIQFTGQFCLFILSRSVSCLCACHRKGPTYYPLGFQQSLPNRCLGPQVGPTFWPTGGTLTNACASLIVLLYCVQLLKGSRSISGKEWTSSRGLRGPSQAPLLASPAAIWE